MEQQQLRQWEAKCIQEEPPKCQAGCPLNVDSRGFARAMREGRFQDARAKLDTSMPLPRVTASLCEAPCRDHCLRSNLGGAITLNLLERTCLQLTTSRSKVMLLPPRLKTVALIGGGPSSLVVAFDLSRKGYPVTIYHTTAPGDWLNQLPPSRLPAVRLKRELDNLTRAGVVFRMVTLLDQTLLSEVREKNSAVYVGADGSIASELLILAASSDPVTRLADAPDIFAGGMSADTSNRYIKAAAQGREAATSLDRYLQGASLTASRILPRQGRTKLHTTLEGLAPASPVSPMDGQGYSEEEAIAEANRCLDCQCLECVRHCVYLEKFGSYPKVYARQIYNNGAIVKGSHQANTLINSCSLCRQCEVFCPHDFSMADLCLQARQSMVKESRMPPSAHAFALDELHSSLDERSLLIRHAPGLAQSATLLFPGCQLTGVRPLQVRALYDYLRRKQADIGIWLGCCGAPAHWAGREEESAVVAGSLRDQWQKMGRPQVLAACSSCLQMFADYLPEIEAISVWNQLPPPTEATAHRHALALSDPCTTRHDPITRQNVRNLLRSIGQELSPLPMSGEHTECCGYGGLMADANPDLALEVAQKRGQQNQAQMLTYCIMCREQLARSGKPSLHLLDLLFPDSAITADSPPVSLSHRRSNRSRLRSQLLNDLYQEQSPPAEPWTELELNINEMLLRDMDERRILRQDVQQVLYQAEQTQKWLERKESPDRIASALLGKVMVWVLYTVDNGKYHILKVWSHRMQIVRIHP